MEIIELLTQNLGVREDQAKGGVGAIFQMVKGKLSDENFSKVAGAVPAMDQLLEAAPEIGGLGGAIGGISSAFGGGAEKLGGLASLGSQFEKLGLDSGMIGKFVPIIISFVQSKGGDSVKNLLEGVLR
jgi:hypothetical protein